MKCPFCRGRRFYVKYVYGVRLYICLCCGYREAKFQVKPSLRNYGF